MLTLFFSGLRRVAGISTPGPVSKLDRMEALQASELLLGGQGHSRCLYGRALPVTHSYSASQMPGLTNTGPVS